MSRFSKESILELVKDQLEALDKTKKKKIGRALAAAVEDYTMRLHGAGITAYKSETLSTGSAGRTITLKGNNFDLDYILFLIITDSDGTNWIDYKDRENFQRNFNPSIDSPGLPSAYTVMKDDGDGFPVVTFDVAPDEAYSLDVYYLPQGSPEIVSRFRNPLPIVSGTLAWFWGRTTERGASEYNMFLELTGLARASNSQIANPQKKFKRSQAEDEINFARKMHIGKRA